MTDLRMLIARFAVVGVCIIALVGVANAQQITGTVIKTDLSPIKDAHVEIWTSYPDGIKLDAVFSSVNGEFTFSGLASGTYDIRVWKGQPTDMYFPGYAFDVAYPSSDVLIILTPAPEVDPTIFICDYSDAEGLSEFAGYPLRRGDIITVKDPDGVTCGAETRIQSDETDGYYQIDIYGDDPGTEDDEGPINGQELTFFINNKPADIVGTTPIFKDKDFFKFPIESATNNLEGVQVTGPADRLVSPGEIVDITFTVTNKGNHDDAFDLMVLSLDGSWFASIPGGAATSVLGAGASEDVTVQVEVPITAFDGEENNIFLFGTSQANNTIIGVGQGELMAQSTGIFEEGGTVPDQYFLAQNHPNPFNPSTQISFGLQTGGHTTVVVYNLLGQQVRSLVDEYLVAGAHVVTWDGTNMDGDIVPSGIYFYRIISGNFSKTRKMVLMK